jgi:mono/diheme cytochrome c family protein
MKLAPNAALVLLSGTATTFLVAGVIAMGLARPAAATAQFAQQTGKSCGDCHTNPKGGGALTPLGAAFKSNGNKLPAASK